MANWKKWLNDGLVETVKQNQTEIKKAAAKLAIQGAQLGQQAFSASQQQIQQLYQDSGLQTAPNPETHPLEALRFDLVQLLSHLMQTPKSESYYLASALTNSVTDRLLSKHKIGAMLSLARNLGNHSDPSNTSRNSQFTNMAAQNASLSSLGRLLGGGLLSRIIMAGGLGAVAGKNAYLSAESQARRYDDLSDIERSMVDRASLLISSVDELLSHPQADQYTELTLARDEFNQSLQQHEVELCQGLQASHAKALASLIKQGLTHLKTS